MAGLMRLWAPPRRGFPPAVGERGLPTGGWTKGRRASHSVVLGAGHAVSGPRRSQEDDRWPGY